MDGVGSTVGFMSFVGSLKQFIISLNVSESKLGVSRHEICQNVYTTRFSGHKFYTLKARLFPLTLQKCIRIRSFLVKFELNL